MKFAKSALAGLLILSCVLGAAGCGEKTSSGGTDDNPPAVTPGGENPGGENPGGENPGGENPGGENPGGENPGGENPGGTGEETLMEYHRYDLKTYLTPFWEGNTVYNETLWFAGDDVLRAPLMYFPDEIISVMSYDLKTTYEENRDYEVDPGDKHLYLPDDTRIPHMSTSDYYTSVSNGIQCRNGGYLYFQEGTDISSRQVVVTYKHSDVIDWIMPRIETDRFPKTMEKLEKGEKVNVVFYGDSITVGANSSGYVGMQPRAESYPEMVSSYMKKRFPAAQVNYVNNAVGGVDSAWGVNRPGVANQILEQEGDHFEYRVIEEDPDLLFIAFGMNDGGSAESYKDNIREMIDRVRVYHPDVEIMLVSGMIANPESYFYNKDYDAYQNALIELSEEYDCVGVATVLNSVQSVYATGKRFRDCTGNNVNHPNDFMMRVYAQTILYSMFGEDYIDHI